MFIIKLSAFQYPVNFSIFYKAGWPGISKFTKDVTSAMKKSPTDI